MKRVTTIMVLLLVGSVVATTGAVGALENRQADLEIDQPHYVDGDVSQSATNGTTVYEASGESLRIAPQNFEASEVSSYGVEESAGDLSLDEDLGLFRFETTKDGTYHLYWTVERDRTTTVPVNSTGPNGTASNATTTATETVRIQYSATLRVDSTDRQHIPAGQLAEQREAAANWSEFEDTVKSEAVAGPNASMEEETQLAINLLKLKHHPLTALTGNFTQLLLTLFITLGGLLVLLLFGVYHYGTRRSDIKYRHKRESIDAERADLEDQLLEMDERERLATLEGMDWNDIFPDDIARAFRDAFGETVLDGYLRIQETLLPSNLIRDRLEAMHGAGYVAVVEDDNLVTDGGEPSLEGSVATIKPVEEVDPETTTHTLADPSDELVEAIDWDDEELRSFDLAECDLDQSEFSTQLEGATLEDIIEEYDVQMRQFDDNREVFAEYLLEFLQSVEDHDFTDEEGRVRTTRYVLNLFLRVSRLLDEQHDMPLAGIQSDHIEYLLANYNHDEEISEYVSDVAEGRYA